MRELTKPEAFLLRRCLGIDTGRKAPTGNFVWCDERGPTFETATALVEIGAMVRDPDRDSGKMRVFRATKAGGAAIGLNRFNVAIFKHEPAARAA